MTEKRATERYCINCGKMFFTARDKKFCSDKCEEDYQKNNEDKRICVECGAEFIPKAQNAKNQKFCSLECANKNRRKKILIKECSFCGEKFNAPTPQTKYCSEKCQQLAQVNPDYYVVFYRDRFRCRYCGRTPADGIKLTIDHVYPKSKGGKEDKFNLVTACQECNTHKGATLWDKGRIKNIWWKNKKMLENVQNPTYEEMKKEFEAQYPEKPIPKPSNS